MTITPSDAEMLFEIIESALIDVHVALPGCVQSYDAAEQTASIQLQLKRALPKGDGTYTTESLPVLENVPVEFLRSKSFAVTVPVSKGDYGLVVFSEMSLDQWRSKGANTSPGDIGRHTLTGGVFRPGLNPNADKLVDAAHASNLVVGLDGGVQMHVTPGGQIRLGSSGAAEAALLGNAFKTQYDPHTHLTAMGPTGGVVLPLTAAALSTKVKVEL